MTKISPGKEVKDQSLNIRYGFGKSSLGRILVASSDKGVVSILIGDSNSQLIEDR
jgi:hypothetical protein